MPDELIAGRYRVLRELGQGGMGRVLEVEDTTEGVRRALKLLTRAASSDRALRFFQQEFRALADLEHPNLVRVHDFGRVPLEGQDGPVPYFTMECVDGQRLDRWLPAGHWDPGRLYPVLEQIGLALGYLHRRGWVHRDLKPSNVLVQEAEPGAIVVKVMDLGLAGGVESLDAGDLERIRGTAAYLSPEAARGGVVDPRSDLYSLGCVVFELLTGRPPFQGTDPLEVIRAHLDEDPLAPSVLNPEVPAELDALVLGLLAKDPGGRPPSAETFLETLGRLSGRPVAAGEPRARVQQVLGAGFVGREEPLQRLEAFAQAAREGRGSLVLVGGEAGAGKSALFREFKVRCQLQGLDVVSGAGSGRSQGLGPVQLALSQAVAARGPLPGSLERDHARELDVLLGRRDGQPGEGFADGGAGMAEAARALLMFLGRKGPLVWLLDDVADTDPLGAAWLASWADLLAEDRARNAGALPFLWAVSYRTETVARQSPLFRLLQAADRPGVVEEIRLRPLGQDDVRRMLAAMLGTSALTDEFVRRVLEDTGGNPLLVRERLALAVAGGWLEPGDPATLAAEVWDERPLPNRLHEIFDGRLTHVSDGARELLAAAAVLGHADLEPDVLSWVTGLKWERVHDLLTEVNRAGLLEMRPGIAGEPRPTVVHRQLLEAALRRAPETAKRRWHRQALAYADRAGVPPAPRAWEAVADHALHTGQPGKAVEALRRAAELAMRAGVYGEALRALNRAVETAMRQPSLAGALLCELYGRRGRTYEQLGEFARAEEDYRWMLARAEKDALAAERRQALTALGRVLAPQGRHAEAREHFEAAVEAEGEAADGVRALVGLAQVAVARGEGDEAERWFRKALAAAEATGRSDLAAEVLFAEGEFLLDHGRARDALDRFHRARDRTESGAGGLSPARLSLANALALELEGRWVEAVRLYEETLRNLGPGAFRERAALALRLAEAHVIRGDTDAGERIADEMIAAAAAGGWEETALPFHLLRGEILALRARWQEARETGEAVEARARQRRLGRVAVRARLLLAKSWLGLGQLERAEACLMSARALAPATTSAAQEGLMGCLEGELRLVQGRWAEARRPLQEAAFLARKLGARGLEARATVLLGQVHLEEASFDRAGAAARKALRLTDDTDHVREAAEARMLRARVELARPGGDVVRAELDARQALQRARELREPELIWRAEHVLARAADRLGRHAEAVQRLGRARRYLEGQAAKLPDEDARAFRALPARRELAADWERARGRAGHRQGDDAEPESSGAEFERLQQEVAVLTRLLEINRVLNSQRSPSELLQAILDAALELLRADWGVLRLTDGAQWTSRRDRGMGDNRLDPSAEARTSGLAAEVADSAEPFLISHAADDSRWQRRFPEGAPADIVSVLALPLRVQNDVAGAIVVESRRTDRRFTPWHLEIAQRLADQAALALQNARLLEGLEAQKRRAERLNRELERTVQAQRREIANIREELSFTRSSFELRYRLDDLVGASPAMQRVYHRIERLAPKRLPVLITGESGTGKELIARALHRHSDRSDGPFFSVNCAALTATLLESELFGYRKGAFTGADRDKPGFFELAHGGTLFLDEIGELSLEIQAKLLRALERGEILPVGGKEAVRVDVRIVSATHRDLQAMIREGTFREDLFYRIHVASIHVPPLRERKEDIPLLVDHFLARLAQDEGRPPWTVEPEFLDGLRGHDWPGNVRELQHQLLRIAALSRSQTLRLRDLVRYGDLPHLRRAPAGRGQQAPSGSVDTLEETERKQILRALEEAGGNKTRAAALLGINRATLFRKLKRLNL